MDPDFILSQDSKKVSMMADAMYILKARDRLKDLNCVDFQNSSKERRESIHKEYFKIAYPVSKKDEKKVFSNKELLDRISKGK